MTKVIASIAPKYLTECENPALSYAESVDTANEWTSSSTNNSSNGDIMLIAKWPMLSYSQRRWFCRPRNRPEYRNTAATVATAATTAVPLHVMMLDILRLCDQSVTSVFAGLAAVGVASANCHPLIGWVMCVAAIPFNALRTKVIRRPFLGIKSRSDEGVDWRGLRRRRQTKCCRCSSALF